MISYKDILFFIGIGFVTLMLVQSILSFIRSDGNSLKFLALIFIEITIMIVIIRIYDNFGGWERILLNNMTRDKTVKKEVFLNNILKKRQNGEISSSHFCINCGNKYLETNYDFQSRKPKYCKKCGFFLNK